MHVPLPDHSNCLDLQWSLARVLENATGFDSAASTQLCDPCTLADITGVVDGKGTNSNAWSSMEAQAAGQSDAGYLPGLMNLSLDLFLN
jgi:hypothetical protein